MLDHFNRKFLYFPGPLWIPASQLNGLPWLNKVTHLLTYYAMVAYFYFRDLSKNRIKRLFSKTFAGLPSLEIL